MNSVFLFLFFNRQPFCIWEKPQKAFLVLNAHFFKHDIYFFWVSFILQLIIHMLWKRKTTFKVKNWAFDPQNTFGSQTYNFCFGVKCLFFCLICLFSLSEDIYYQWKNKSDLKKIVLTLEKMSIWHQKHYLRFFPNTKRLPIEKWKKKNAVHNEICCRIIFWVLRINKKFFSYLKHCTASLINEDNLIAFG